MTEAAFNEWLEDLNIKVHEEIGTTSTCPTGDPYEEICWTVDGGSVWGFASIRSVIACFSTEELARSLWKAAFDRYSQRRFGEILYWRKKPELIKEDDGYLIYARLFIAEKSEN